MPNISNPQLRFYKEELITAKRNLFTANSVRQLKANQMRIEYLIDMVGELQDA